MNKKITFRLSDTTYEHMKMICDLEGITMTMLIQKALFYYLWNKGDEK